jgi:hypothetical protein
MSSVGAASAVAVIEHVATTQNGVATAAQCRQAGLTAWEVKALCRSRRWLRLNRAAYYVAPHTGEIPQVALVHAAVLSAGPHAVAVLETAADLHNIAGARDSGRIHINLPGPHARDRRSTEPGIVFHQMRLPLSEVAEVRGIPVSSPARTVADLVLRNDRLHAVAVLDSAFNRRLIVPEDLDLVRAQMAGRPGAASAWLWLTDVDARAESPLETRVRLRASDAGLPPDELQYRVRDCDNQIIAVTDLAWLRRRVIGEADGKGVHGLPSAVFADRKRQNAIIAANFHPIRFTWEDTLGRDYVPRAIHAAEARGWEASGRWRP